MHDDAHVGNFVEIKNSEIGKGSKANHLSYIGDSTVGSRVNIGAGTITCNYDGANKFRTIIEDDAFIGSDTQLVAPVTVGKGATIGAGSTITTNAPAGELTISRGRQTTIAGWKRPVSKKEMKLPSPSPSRGIMCGIVGAVAKRNVVPILVNGLLRLEYRGYDSAGLVVVRDGKLDRVRSTGRVAELATKSANTYGELGIAHTRWATHGVPSERNAHPHISRNLIAVVHNGIIENYEELRTDLTAQGYEFTSDTDTEVIAHLIHSHYAQGSLLVATQMALSQLVGAYAIGVVAADNPHQLIASRKGSPLLLGVGEGEHFVASDMSALLQVTKNVVYLEEGDVVEVNLANYRIFDAQGKAVQRPVHVSELNNDSVELGEYQHYMQKEIHEQPQALADTLESVCNSQSMVPGIFGAEANTIFPQVDSILILACGTSNHAGRWRATGWKRSRASVQRGRSPANIAIAPASPIPRHWW